MRLVSPMGPRTVRPRYDAQVRFSSGFRTYGLGLNVGPQRFGVHILGFRLGFRLRV